jgi:two-component system, cell cycle sensor histidine kinase and response regulator CckA
MSSPPRHRILLIDDNPAIHDDYRKVLAPELHYNPDFSNLEAIVLGEATAKASEQHVEFEIDSAMQGQDGHALVEQALAAQRPYSMAFVDMRMDPGWNGIETIKRIWQLQPDLQVVLCSAYSDYSWKEIVAELGASDGLVILRKPFDNVEVLQLALSLSRKWFIMQQIHGHLRHLDGQVTERSQQLEVANAQLRQEIVERSSLEERFRLAFCATPMAMCIVDISNVQWIDANEAFAALAGCSTDDLKAQRITAGSFWSRQPKELVAMLSSNEKVVSRECAFRSLHGQNISISFSREFMQVGGRTHVLLVLEDVTVKRKSQDKDNQSMKMEAIGRLAAGVAHDFNNIMTVIKGHTSLLLSDEKLPITAHRALEQMSDAARRATDLVRQLLAFGRQQIVVARPVDVKHHVELQAKLLVRLIDERVSLKWECPSGLAPALVDPGSLDQILLNLVINARDAMPNGGHVTIKTSAVYIEEEIAKMMPDAHAGDFILIQVTDTGTGIDPSIQSQIFEPFFSTKEQGKGTGLGLATVHGLVKQQGGWLSLDSTLGCGSTFSIYLPQSNLPVDKPVHMEKQSAESWSIGGGRIALIVEDDETIRSVLRQLLSKFGFEVYEAASAMQALEIWRDKQSSIQLVITDVMMPGSMSGLDLGQRIAADRPRVKLVYSTGYSADLVGGDHALVEGDNYLPKPYDAGNLSKILTRHFQRPTLGAAALSA